MTDSPAPTSQPGDLARTDRLHRDALALLTSWRAPDAAQELVRRRYVAHVDAHEDGLRRSCFPDHVTASALILSADGEQALLTLHAKAHAWFQTGGHCEDADTTLAGAALREAAEESGIEGIVLDGEPLQLNAHPVPFCDPRGTVTHLDVRFLAVAPPGAVHAVSEESLDVRWFPWNALPTDDPDMHDLARLARDRLTRGSRTS